MAAEHVQAFGDFAETLHHDTLMRPMENIPDVEPTVTRQINRAATDTADRHPDVLQFFLVPGGNGCLFRCIPLGQRGGPCGLEVIVPGNDSSVERFGRGPKQSAATANDRQKGGGGGDFEKIATLEGLFHKVDQIYMRKLLLQGIRGSSWRKLLLVLLA